MTRTQMLLGVLLIGAPRLLAGVSPAAAHEIQIDPGRDVFSVNGSAPHFVLDRMGSIARVLTPTGIPSAPTVGAAHRLAFNC